MGLDVIRGNKKVILGLVEGGGWGGGRQRADVYKSVYICPKLTVLPSTSFNRGKMAFYS